MKKQEELAALCQQCGCTMLVQEPLRYHTTFRIGGACSAYIKINSVAAGTAILQRKSTAVYRAWKRKQCAGSGYGL